MTPLFKKLNLGDHHEILVMNAPESFEPELEQLEDVEVFRKTKRGRDIGFAIYFVTTLKGIAVAAKTLSQAKGDPVIWFAYPKGTSKNYKCEFNRDNGWDALGEAGFEGVRQVAIDADWSALRFRRVEHIKSLKRSSSMALTKEGIHCNFQPLHFIFTLLCFHLLPVWFKAFTSLLTAMN